MSRSQTMRLTCSCGEPLNITVYDYVNVMQDPHLRYTILVGLLNSATCLSCGKRTAITHPFIYSDPAHQLLAFVHPRHDAPVEARQLILDQLSEVYLNIVDQAESTSNETGAAEIPPLQVIFGLDQLSEVINADLNQNERLGKLVLSTRSRDAAERGQMLVIARKLAQEMQCLVEEEALPDEYTIWLFGARRQIGAIMRELAHT